LHSFLHVRRSSQHDTQLTTPDVFANLTLPHTCSALTFNDSGDQLASVGGWPDYLLTLWSWEEEAIVLRSKAFSQDVYTIKYSPYFQVGG
jgi:hypothetical protein